MCCLGQHSRPVKRLQCRWGEKALVVPPNGLPFSCRERTAETCQKPTDLGREAVGWNGVFGRLADRGFGDYVAIAMILCTLTTSQIVRATAVPG
jgi:hypothetical protein